MGRVLTNTTGLSYTQETSLGVAGTRWFQTEPNDISKVGPEITTVARSPISLNRQRRKGTVTDLDSAVEFTADVTLSSIFDFAEGFCFAVGTCSDVMNLRAAGASTAADTFTGITAFNAVQAAKLPAGALIWVVGSAYSSNNGLKELASAATDGGTTLAVTANLTNETNDLTVSFAGMRLGSGTATWDWDGALKRATLAASGIGATADAMKLTPGQFVHIGSIPNVGGAIQNAFQNSTANDMHGYARVVSIASGAIVLDKVDAALQFDDASAPAAPVDVTFGSFYRNVPVGDADYVETTYQFEVADVNLDTGGGTMYEYARGNFANTLSLDLPLANKATASFAFVGIDTDPPVAEGSRKTGADAALVPSFTGALNTSADIARLRITNVDETGLTTDFKSASLKINNNVTPEKVLGTLGAKYVNAGNFEVDFDCTVIFSSAAVLAAIRQNTTCSMDFVVGNDDGIIAVDLPSITLGGGGREYPRNESVNLRMTVQSFGDAVLNSSIGISISQVPILRT